MLVGVDFGGLICYSKGMEITEPTTLEYDTDTVHVQDCKKPLAACSVCADAYGLKAQS